ncbi:MAG: 23S rRNA (adenine(2503)-C(2))-methyltransferase RlmN [Deltaproteobacteria bacterium]|nr:23S rRNA (adenine(2503)-C(2))-methyltransferase RlmN [Deltaproteobacteria bacterium]
MAGETKHLSGLLPAELEDLTVRLGEKPYRGRQLFEQIHARLATSLDDVSVLPAALRQHLSAQGFSAHGLTISKIQESSDTTVKMGLSTSDGLVVESVLIPMETGAFTQCMSSQAGCALGCAFCMTGMLGWTRNLTAAEIVDQHLLALAGFPERPVKNLVFMGMGEPLLNVDEVVKAIRLLQHERGRNLSPRRITVSTAGIVPGIRRLGQEVDCLLAVSLNAPTQELRAELMPVSRRYPLDELMAALKGFPLPPRRRITFEYVLLPGVNDSPAHARDLVRLLSHIRCKVNLIPFNPFPGSRFARPSDESVDRFLELLAAKQMVATIRRSRGSDILAACGQLAGTKDDA